MKDVEFFEENNTGFTGYRHRLTQKVKSAIVDWLIAKKFAKNQKDALVIVFFIIVFCFAVAGAFFYFTPAPYKAPKPVQESGRLSIPPDNR